MSRISDPASPLCATIPQRPKLAPRARTSGTVRIRSYNGAVDISDQIPEWPEGVDVVVLGGLASGDVDGLGPDQIPIPDDTTNVVKLLRERGLAVEHAVPRERRAEVARWSGSEYIVPILLFTSEVMANGAGAILAEVIMQRLAMLRPGQQLHVKTARVETKEMSAEWFEGDGPADEVIEALRAFGE